jgi:hypothetical protein
MSPDTCEPERRERNLNGYTASRYVNGRIAWLFQKYARMMMPATAA